MRKELMAAFLFMSLAGSSSMAQQTPSLPTFRVAPQPLPGAGFPQAAPGAVPQPSVEPELESCERIASIFFQVSPERRLALADRLRNCIDLALR